MKIEFARASTAKIMQTVASFSGKLVGSMQYCVIRARGTDISVSLLSPEGRITCLLDGMADSSDEEIVVVHAATFAGLLQRLESDKVMLHAEAGGVVQLRAGRHRYKLRAPNEHLPQDNEPSICEEVQQPADATPFTIDAAVLADMAQFCAHAMASNDVRKYLNGMFISLESRQLVVAASDGHRGAYTTFEIAESQPAEWRVILHHDTVRKVLPVIPDVGQAVIAFGNGEFYMGFDGGMRIVLMPVQERFPDLARMIHTEPASFSVKADTFAAATERAAFVYRDTQAKFPKLNVTAKAGGQAVQLTFEHGEREFDEEIDAECAGDVDTLFSVAYLREIMVALGGKVTASMGKEKGAMVFRRDDRPGRIGLVMPCG